MADYYTWKLSEIRQRFRDITGLKTTSQMSSAECDKRINDYYQHYFPEEAGVDDLRTFFSSNTAITDDGSLALAQTDIRLDEPMTSNDDEIRFYRDHEAFFRDYPENEQEQFVTTPTLAIGSLDTKAIKNSAFAFKIGDYSYEKAAAETSFPAGLSTVPQNKYGAFALKTDEDGTVTISEADDNSTGYDSARLAVEDLDLMDGNSCFMGFVVVKPSGAGGFVPGTTDLSTDTDTFTDGAPELRYPPDAACIYQEKLWIRPKANDIYRIRAPRLIRPDVFANDDAVPADPKWGPAIALGAAIYHLLEDGKDLEKVKGLDPVFTKRIASISKKRRDQLIGGQVERSF